MNLPAPETGADTREPQGQPGAVDSMSDLPLCLTTELGSTTMTIRETLTLAPGALIPLDKAAGASAELFVNGRRFAYGEVTATDGYLALRITNLCSP